MNRIHLGFVSACMIGMALAGTAHRTRADSPGFAFELKLRSNIVDGYHLPPLSSFLGSDARINERGDVAIALSAIGGENRAGIWSSLPDGRGQHIVYQAPEGSMVSDLALSPRGDLVFDLRSEDFRSAGAHAYFASSGEVERVVDPRRTGSGLRAQFFRMPQWIGPRAWGFVAKGFDEAVSIESAGLIEGEGVHSPSTSRGVYSVTAELDGSSPYSYLFNAAFNSAGSAAAKVRLGAGASDIAEGRPDRILLWDKPGAPARIVAEDRDSSAQSPFEAFDNSVDLTEDGAVAFVATRVDGRRGVYFWKDSQGLREIAVTGGGPVSQILLFGVAANRRGQVAFRGRDERGLEVIFLGDGTSLRKVVSKHDLLPSDRGTARVDQHEEGMIVFGGAVDLNDRGEVVFCAALTPKDDSQSEWGTGVYVARAAQAPRFFERRERGTTPASSASSSSEP